jgi:hypothetical protein
LGIPDVEHWRDKPTHQHFPKKGMGGNNPKSKIVAILCPTCHDRIDNGDWGNRDLGRKYIAWDLHGKILIERPVLSDGAEGETDSKVPSGRQEPLGSAEVPEPLEARSEGQPSASSPSAGEEESDGLKSGDGRGRADDAGVQLEPQSEDATLDTLPPLARSGIGVQRGDPVLVLTHEQRVAIAQEIRDAQLQRQWRAGDTANQWEDELGEDFWNLYANEFGYTYPSLRNVMRVCKRIPPKRRHPEASFALHDVVDGFDFETQEAWLERAFNEEWTVKRLREEMVVEGLLTAKPKVKRWPMEKLLEGLEDWPQPTDRPRPKGAVRAYLTWLGDQG